VGLDANPNGLRHEVNGTPDEPVTAVVTQGMAVVSQVNPQVRRTVPALIVGVTDLQWIWPSARKRPCLVSAVNEVGAPAPPIVDKDRIIWFLRKSSSWLTGNRLKHVWRVRKATGEYTRMFAEGLATPSSSTPTNRSKNFTPETVRLKKTAK